MRNAQQESLSWKKSSRSNPTNCVELAWPVSLGAVRDSKNAGGPVLLFDRARFAEFVSATKAAAFHH